MVRFVPRCWLMFSTLCAIVPLGASSVNAFHSASEPMSVAGCPAGDFTANPPNQMPCLTPGDDFQSAAAALSNKLGPSGHAGHSAVRPQMASQSPSIEQRRSSFFGWALSTLLTQHVRLQI
jgi:hypothetical protein